MVMVLVALVSMTVGFAACYWLHRDVRHNAWKWTKHEDEQRRFMHTMKHLQNAMDKINQLHGDVSVSAHYVANDGSVFDFINHDAKLPKVVPVSRCQHGVTIQFWDDEAKKIIEHECIECNVEKER